MAPPQPSNAPAWAWMFVRHAFLHAGEAKKLLRHLSSHEFGNDDRFLRNTRQRIEMEVLLVGVPEAPAAVAFFHRCDHSVLAGIGFDLLTVQVLELLLRQVGLGHRRQHADVIGTVTAL